MADDNALVDTPGVGYSPGTEGLPLLGNALANAGQAAQSYLNALNRSVYFDPASRKAVGDAVLGPQLNQTVGQVLNSPAANDAFGVAGGLGPAVGAIRAFHGSPYDFERFDVSKIGTGEGAQAYGHGLYFAENPEVARQYREMLGRGDKIAVGGQPLDKMSGDYYDQRALQWIQSAVRGGGGIDEAIGKASADLDYMRGPNGGKQAADSAEKILERLQQFKQQGVSIANPGRMYEVNINAHPEQFLDWDKPLAQQNDAVQSAYAKAKLGDALKDPLVSELFGSGPVPPTYLGLFDKSSGAQAYNTLRVDRSQEQYVRPASVASSKLQEAGIPGIKYLDQGSRGSANWVARHPQGGTFEYPSEQEAKAFVARNPEYSLEPPKQTSNYVVFDPKIVDIVKKYGIAGMAALPPATAAFLSERIIPVDHDPFAEQ